jgi:hypothetical protein
MTSFPFPILSNNDGKFVNINNKRIALGDLTVGYLREFMCPEVDLSVMRELKLWKVNVKKQVIKDNISTEEDIKQKLHGEEMEPEEPFERYFQNELNKKFVMSNIHIITIILSTGKCLPMVYLLNKKFLVKKIRNTCIVSYSFLFLLITSISLNVSIFYLLIYVNCY